MVKRRGGKKQQEELKKQQHVIVTENSLLQKVLLQKVFEITTENSPASLTTTAEGAADLPARNLPQREEFHATPLSSLLDYF